MKFIGELLASFILLCILYFGLYFETELLKEKNAEIERLKATCGETK